MSPTSCARRPDRRARRTARIQPFRGADRRSPAGMTRAIGRRRVRHVAGGRARLPGASRHLRRPALSALDGLETAWFGHAPRIRFAPTEQAVRFSYFPGEWADPPERWHPLDVYRGITGGVAAILLRWKPARRTPRAPAATPHPRDRSRDRPTTRPLLPPDGWFRFLGESRSIPLRTQTRRRPLQDSVTSASSRETSIFPCRNPPGRGRSMRCHPRLPKTRSRRTTT